MTRTLKIYSLSKFQEYCTLLLIIVTTLYSRSLELIPPTCLKFFILWTISPYLPPQCLVIPFSTVSFQRIPFLRKRCLLFLKKNNWLIYFLLERKKQKDQEVASWCHDLSPSSASQDHGNICWHPVCTGRPWDVNLLWAQHHKALH